MSWWGKVIGGAFGYLLGGPLGALLGIALGHQFDRGLALVLSDQGLGGSEQTHERIQAAFFTATFSIMGHVAKADGRVSETEIALAREVMARMALSPEQKKVAIRLFTEGKEADFPLDEVLAQFKRETQRRRSLIQMFLEIQIFTALADGSLHDQERAVLLHVAQSLGYTRGAFEQLVAMVQAQQQYAGREYRAERSPSAVLEDAYTVLGVSASATDSEVKRAYRRLMSQHHPDKLVAKGLPEEMMELAKQKAQEITAAYEQIKKARGL